MRCSAARTFSSTVMCGNTAEIWNERTMPRRAVCAGFSMRDVGAVEQDACRAVGVQEFGQQVEEGGLAGAVGADQRVDMAAPDLQVHLVDGHEALEFLGQAHASQE